MQIICKNGIIIISDIFKVKAVFHINSFTTAIVPGLGRFKSGKGSAQDQGICCWQEMQLYTLPGLISILPGNVKYRQTITKCKKINTKLFLFEKQLHPIQFCNNFFTLIY